MGLALLIARLLLAGVFVVAGLAKLGDLAGSRQAMRDFGVPALLAAPFGLLLPLAELAVAIALIPTVSAWWGALGALVLLLLFIVGIGYNLARGRQPECHCFGQLHSTPAGWPTLMRNLVLAIIASFIVGLGRVNAGLSIVNWLDVLTTAQRIELFVGVILLALLAALVWILFQVLGQQGRLQLRLEAVEAQLAAGGVASTRALPGLPVGTSAPAFRLADLKGEEITLDELRTDSKPVLLIFADPDCGPCQALLPDVGRWQRKYASKLTLAVLSSGTPGVNRKATKHAVTHMLLQQDREVAQAYQTRGTPSAVLVLPDGTIGSPLAQGADAIRALVARAVDLPVLHSQPPITPLNGNGAALPAPPNQPIDLKIGEPALEFTLPGLDGQSVSPSDFYGSPMLMLFWNPGCSFCQQMLADLKVWEANPPTGAPKLLVVSRGTVEENKAMGLRSPVVLDEGFNVGRLFGATGTPMALLVDAQGNIASELAVGARAVLELASSSKDPAQPAIR